MSLFGFGGKGKAAKPNELVKSVKDCCALLDKKDKNDKVVGQAAEEIAKNLAGMKFIMFGDAEHEPSQDLIVQLANEVYSSDVLVPVLQNLKYLDFEARKDNVAVVTALLRRQVGSRSPTVEHVARNTAILDALVLGYESADSALSCGPILRDCCRHEVLVKPILFSPHFWKFFKFVESANFDIASDSFSTLKELLTKHKSIVAEFLDKNYDAFFENYTSLLSSSNYVTKRQSLKLLGELLLDRANFSIMTKYISDDANLKLMMKLLIDKSKSIQFEAFHVFKVFVANPNKPQAILHILSKNKDKLVSFLSNFHTDKDAEDDQFNDEKAFLLKQIQQLPSNV